MYFLNAVRRRIFEPVWAVWCGSPFLQYWRELERTQYLPKDEIQQRQLDRLAAIVRYVYENNAYYRMRFNEAQINPDNMRYPEDFQRIPVLTKRDIRQHQELLISKGYEKKRLMEAKTGGSTGKYLHVYFTEQCSEWRNACARRHDRWSGWEVGEPKAYVWGNPKYQTGMKNRLRSFLLSPVLYLDTMAVTKDSVCKFAQDWKTAKPTLLFGHAHSLYILAKAVIEHGIDEIRPKAIISSSMALLPHERILIESTFGLKVFDRYGCEEVGLIASECEMHRGMHINTDNLYVEYLNEDGNPTASGQYGKIVVTDLTNWAMPFIRYRIEDMAVPCDGECPCGRTLPLMKEVSGRIADFLVRKDGARVAGISLIENTLTKYHGIEQMQIIQDDLDRMTLNIVRDSRFGEDSIRSLERSMRDVFGSDLDIHFNFVNEILPEPNGKYRFSICRIPYN
ncbi:MAG: phenylacetate--CoA ligase family protein [Syntrophaceae bacterium]|nr:phenylacetate--CoA ligase family protein [Syntrophaceae bacterium]